MGGELHCRGKSLFLIPNSNSCPSSYTRKWRGDINKKRKRNNTIGTLLSKNGAILSGGRKWLRFYFASVFSQRGVCKCFQWAGPLAKEWGTAMCEVPKRNKNRKETGLQIRTDKSLRTPGVLYTEAYMSSLHLDWASFTSVSTNTASSLRTYSKYKIGL